jgi:predicted GNAT family acetyltransferase
MSVGDIQIGATATLPEHRGKGLAARAILETVERLSSSGRTFWYLTEDTNAASLAVIRKVGFKFVGYGRLVPRYGIGAIGHYELDTQGI